MKLTKLALSISVGLSASLLSNVSVANPDINTAQIVNGQVSFSQPNANTLQINNSHGAIINWQDFSINAGELTHFQQSGANSAVLNNITGGSVSNIFGSLTSNGQVYLINPAGIVFGQNSIVNTAGFIASTLNLSNQDFLDGKLNFNGVDAGDILNQGFITAGANGDIALIAPNITNEGVISVEHGDVILAAGEHVTLASLDASAVGFEIQSAENSVTNLGSVTTDGGAVGMFADTLKHEGVIEANALSLDENGNVILVAKNNLTVSESATISANGDNGGHVVIQNENGTTWVSGTVEAIGENGKGGVVDILGQQVGVIDNASVNANGKTGGGEIHIGGNYQGKGELQNAEGTFVGKNTSLSVDAIESGNGGEIIVWADGATRVYGSLSASGGELNGDGGFIETSGKQYLDVTGILIDVAATDGEHGEWLLDPADISISSGGNAGTIVSPLPNFTVSSDTSNILFTDLITALNTNANVTISTAGVGASLGDILIDANLDISAGNTSTLTLNADNNITVSGNGSIALSGGSNLTLEFNANNDIFINGGLSATDTSVLNVNFTADADANNIGALAITTPITTNAGFVNLKAGSGINLGQDADINALTGTIDLSTTAGDISLQSALAAAFAADIVSANTITINAAGLLVLENNGTAATIDSINNNIALIADDMQLDGSVNAGTANLLISSNPGQAMDIGAPGAANFVLDATEYGALTAGSMFLGQAGIGDVNLNAAIDVTTAITIEGFNINFNHATGTAINANGDVSLIAAGSINGNALNFLDVSAPNIDLSAQSGIGSLNPIEIQLSVSPGLLRFNNNSGNVFIQNTAQLTTHTMRLSGSNFGVGGAVVIENNLGITDVDAPGVVSTAGLLELTALQINVNADLDNNNFGDPVAMKLLGDEIEINANIFSASGGLVLSNLNIGLLNFELTSNATGDLDFSQAEIDFINASSIEFGDISNTSDMIFSAPINFAAANVSFNAAADIQFSQGASTAITTTGLAKLNSAANIVGQATAFVDINATQLEFLSGNGFGDTIGDAIEVSVGLLSGTNSAGSIYIDSAGALTTGIITQNGTAPVWIESNGDLTIATINAAGGDVLLDTTALTNGVGGGIFDDGAATINIDGASVLDIFSETGVGTSIEHLTVRNIASNINADIASPGDIYIDNDGTNSGSVFIGSLTTSAGEIFFRNLNDLQTTDINTLVSAAGLVTIESNSDININNNVQSTDGSDVNLLVVGAAGSVNVNAQVQSTTGLVNLNTVNGDIAVGSTGSVVADTADLIATNGSILFTAGGNVNAATINLDATVSIDDGLTTNAIGGGSVVSLLNARSGGNITLDGTSNNAVLVNLSSTSGNISYTDIDDVLIGGVHATDDGTDTGNVIGDVTINSGGSVIDGNGVATNISATNIIVNAVTGIGADDQIETRTGTSLSFSNGSDGSVDFNELTNGTIQFWGTNGSLTATDFTRLVSQAGSIEVPAGQTLSTSNTNLVLDVVNPAQILFINGTVSISDPTNEITLLAPTLNLGSTGSVTATGTTGFLSVLLKVDDLITNAGGTVNSGLGDLAIENLTDGNTISLGGATGDLSITQLDIDAFTAGRLGIGLNGGFGTGGVLIEGAIDFGTTDTKLAAVGDIAFNQAGNGLTSTANIELNAEGAILNLTNGGFDVVANGLNLVANNGIAASNPLVTQVAGLSVFNQVSGDANVINTGTLSIAGSANLGGSLLIKTDGVLTLSSNVGAAGAQGIAVSNNLTLEGIGGLLISDVASANSINLLSDNGITINNTVTANNLLQIDADTDNNTVGDLTFENISGGALNITGGNMILHGENVNLLASGGAVHVISKGGMNLVADNNLTITGSEIDNGDAYLSFRTGSSITVGGNLLLTGGGGLNAKAAIFDEAGVGTNNLNLTVAGTASLNGGLGNNSGAIIRAANLLMDVAGDLSLTGGDGNSSPAIISSTTGVMSVKTAANLSLVNGIGIGSPALIVSNEGYGFIDLKYLTCTGCDTGVKFLSEPIINDSSNEVVSTFNALQGTEPLISSSEALFERLQQHLEEEGVKPSLREAIRDQIAANEDETGDDKQSIEENEVKPRVLVCR